MARSLVRGIGVSARPNWARDSDLSAARLAIVAAARAGVSHADPVVAECEPYLRRKRCVVLVPVREDRSQRGTARVLGVTHLLVFRGRDLPDASCPTLFRNGPFRGPRKLASQGPIGTDSYLASGAPGSTRTTDKRIRRPLLYPLSYEGVTAILLGFRDRCSAPSSIVPSTAGWRCPEIRTAPEHPCGPAERGRSRTPRSVRAGQTVAG